MNVMRRVTLLSGIGTLLLSTSLWAQSPKAPMGQSEQPVQEDSANKPQQIMPPRNDVRDIEAARKQLETEAATERGVNKATARDCPAGFTRNTKANSAEECVPISESASGVGDAGVNPNVDPPRPAADVQ